MGNQVLMLALAVSVAIVGVYVYQDGMHSCPDGERYTSGKEQPTPFNRRLHCWNDRVLKTVSITSLVMLGVMMGGPVKAAYLLALPGFWFIATHATCVDAPAMMLAWTSALLFKAGYPELAVLASIGSGVIHERGPVFAAIYAWSPWMLLGLVGVQWWVKGAKSDGPFVGHKSTWQALIAHKKSNVQDFLNGFTVAWGFRGVLVLGAWYGLPLSAWAALGAAQASRMLGTDRMRLLVWAAPPMVYALPESMPLWLLGLHVITFKRGH